MRPDEDLSKMIASCLTAMERPPWEILTKEETVYLEFYKFCKKYMEERS